MSYSDPFGLCPEGVEADSAGQSAKRQTTIYCNDGSVEVRQGGTWTWRNNNPGNLRAAGLATRGKSGGFAVFANSTEGNEAMWRQFMLDAKRGMTLSSMIERYAPRSENNTDAYVSFVSHRSGIAPGTPLNSLTEISISAIIEAMKEHEGWRAGTLTIH